MKVVYKYKPVPCYTIYTKSDLFELKNKLKAEKNACKRKEISALMRTLEEIDDDVEFLDI